MIAMKWNFTMFGRTPKRVDALMEQLREVSREREKSASRLETTIKRVIDAKQGIPGHDNFEAFDK